MTYTFRSINPDGTINEVDLTPEQALDLGARGALTYTAHDAAVLVDDDGTITLHQSAIPPQRDDAA